MLGWKEVQYSILKDELAHTFDLLNNQLVFQKNNFRNIIRSCEDIKSRRLVILNLKIEEEIAILYELGNMMLLEHKEEPEILDIINV